MLLPLGGPYCNNLFFLFYLNAFINNKNDRPNYRPVRFCFSVIVIVFSFNFYQSFCMVVQPFAVIS